MKISFDLDGVICSTDWGYLDRLRDKYGKEIPADAEEKYYACLENWLNPYDFLGVDDEVVFLTGRNIRLKEVTEKWLKKNGYSNIPVVFTRTLKGQPTATRDEFLKLGIDKAIYCLANNIDIHFDDNEQVVLSMRKTMEGKVKPTAVIHYGSHVAW